MPKITDMLIGPHGALSQSSFISSTTSKTSLHANSTKYLNNSIALPNSSTPKIGPPTTNSISNSVSVHRQNNPSNVSSALPISSTVSTNDQEYTTLISRLSGLIITENILDTLYTKSELFMIVSRYGFRNILKLQDTTKTIFIATCMKLIRLGRIKIPPLVTASSTTSTNTSSTTSPHNKNLSSFSSCSNQILKHNSSIPKHKSLSLYTDPIENMDELDSPCEYVSPTTQLALEGLLENVLIDDDMNNDYDVLNENDRSIVDEHTILINQSNIVSSEKNNNNALNANPTMESILPVFPENAIADPTEIASIPLILPPSLSFALPSRKLPKEKVHKEYENAPILDDDAYYIDSDEISVALSSGSTSDGNEVTMKPILVPTEPNSTDTASNPLDALKAKLSFATTKTMQANKILAESNDGSIKPKFNRKKMNKSGKTESHKDAAENKQELSGTKTNPLRRKRGRPASQLMDNQKTKLNKLDDTIITSNMDSIYSNGDGQVDGEIMVPTQLGNGRTRSRKRTTNVSSMYSSQTKGISQDSVSMIDNTNVMMVDKAIQTDPVTILATFETPLPVKHGIAATKRISTAIDHGYEPDHEYDYDIQRKGSNTGILRSEMRSYVVSSHIDNGITSVTSVVLGYQGIENDDDGNDNNENEGIINKIDESNYPYYRTDSSDAE